MDSSQKYLENCYSYAADCAKGCYGCLTQFFTTPIGTAHLLNAMYGTGFTVQVAMLPFLVMELNAPVVYNGYLLGAFSALQFFGSIVFGRLADWLGPRNAFLIALGSSAMMFSMAAFSTKMWMLFLAQIPAFLMQGFQAAALLICFETDTTQRTPSIAYLNLSYGIGMILGGLIAAMFSIMLGPRGVMLVAACIAIAGCLVSFRLDQFDELKVSQPPPSPRDFGRKLKEECSRMVAIVGKCSSICLLLVFGLLPILMTRFSFAPVAVDLFELSPTEAAYLIAYIGTLTVLAEGLLAPALAVRLGDVTCARYSVVLAVTGYIGLAIAGPYKIAVLILLILPLCGGALLYVCGTSQMTKRVEKGEFGSVLGVNGAIFYLIAGVSPVVALLVYSSAGVNGYWAACALLSGLLAIYIFFVDEKTFNAYPPDRGTWATNMAGSVASGFL